MDQRYGHEALGLGGCQAADQVAASHAGIDQHDDRAGLEQAEHQRDELDARPDQQGQPRAGGDAQAAQARGDAIGVLFELAKRAGGVLAAPCAAATRDCHCDGVGHLRGGGAQAARDVDARRRGFGSGRLEGVSHG